MGKETEMSRGEMMLQQPIRRVIPRLAVPTIISMLITSIYNMADTYFVGQISGGADGTSAAAAVGVLFSAMAMIQAVAFTIGMGSGANMSRAMGAQNMDEARTFVSLAFFTAVGTGVVLGGLGLCFTDDLVRLLGATESILPHARAYATYIFYATPFMMGSLVMNNLLRFQGLALYGMVGMATGGLLNMVLDPLLIFGLNLGTAGAAIATAISQFVSFCILLSMTNLRRNTLHITFRFFKPSLRLYGRIIYNGLPSMGRQGIAALSTALLNNTAAAWGDPAIAAMSIVTRLIMFINSSVIGFGQGFQPVCAYCYGAGRYSRVREAYRFCVRVSTLILLVLSAVAFIFAEPIVTLFRREDAEVIRIGTRALRFQLMTLPLWGFITMSNMFTQSIGYGVRATIIASARQGIFLIPMLLLLPRLWRLTGLQLAQPAADVLTLLLCLLVIPSILRQMKQMPDRMPARPEET